MYASGSPSGADHVAAPPSARARVRAPASLKIGFGAESLAPDP